MSASARPPAFGGLTLDRAAAVRSDPDLLRRLRDSTDTRVLCVHGDRAPVRMGPAGPTVCWRSPAQVGGHASVPAYWAYLGRSHSGTPLLAAVFAADAPAPPLPTGQAWVTLREAGGACGPADADAWACAVSLGRWLVEAPHCPACGALTDVRDAGWSRRCPACGREHFPRTDPAIIVAVTGSTRADRLLLGSNKLWGANRFSCFAGFVEAGESAEAAVSRELWEESAIRVQDVLYAASQPWPYPRSLMLGFRARAVDDAVARADRVEIAEVRWFTPDEIAEALGRDDWGADGASDHLMLPGPASIAHRLISGWLEDVT